MKLYTILLSLVLLSGGCKKTVEKIQENIVLKAMTEGQWRVTKFTRDGIDEVANYTPYKFQFYANRTVDAINNGSTEKSGSWDADPNAMTITSTFTNAAAPLMQLNGTWKITSNSLSYVEATQTVNGQVLSLRLDK